MINVLIYGKSKKLQKFINVREMTRFAFSQKKTYLV